MATEYKLSYTASEIDEKLGKIDELDTLTLGVYSDGLVYIFKNGFPIGSGIKLGTVGDVFGYVDENNNIVLTGNLAEDTYSVKYEMEDGSLLTIGDLVFDTEEEPEAIVNQIPISINSDGSLFIGTNGEAGYKTNVRLSASLGGETTSSASGLETTGYIPIKYGDTVYIKGITSKSGGSTQLILFYNDSFTYLTNSACETYTVFREPTGEVVSVVFNSTNLNNSNVNTNLAYMRICANEINAESIITINQPIE